MSFVTKVVYTVQDVCTVLWPLDVLISRSNVLLLSSDGKYYKFEHHFSFYNRVSYNIYRIIRKVRLGT